MNKFKSGQGGARKGAGRPVGKKSVTARDRRIRLGIRLPAHMVQWLKDFDRRNVTQRKTELENPGRVIELAIWETFSREMLDYEKRKR